MYKLKVFYEDTDAGGVVYYANYLKFIERARTEILNKKKIQHTYLKNKFNIYTMVKSCNIKYVKPAFLDDELYVKTSLIKKSKFHFYLAQKILKNKNLILDVKIKIVTVNDLGKLTRMPLELYNIF